MVGHPICKLGGMCVACMLGSDLATAWFMMSPGAPSDGLATTCYNDGGPIQQWAMMKLIRARLPVGRDYTAGMFGDILIVTIHLWTRAPLLCTRQIIVLITLLDDHCSLEELLGF